MKKKGWDGKRQHAGVKQAHSLTGQEREEKRIVTAAASRFPKQRGQQRDVHICRRRGGSRRKGPWPCLMFRSVTKTKEGERRERKFEGTGKRDDEREGRLWKKRKSNTRSEEKKDSLVRQPTRTSTP